MFARIDLSGRTASKLLRALFVPLLVAAIGLPACVVQTGTSGGKTETTYSGRATGVSVTTPTGNTVVADTGDLSSAGGALEASSLDVSVAGVLTADALHSSTVGGDGVSSSETSLSNLKVTVLNHTLTADFLMSRADAVCQNGEPQVSNNFEIANLVLDGQVLTVTTGQNQEFDIHDSSGALVGTVTVNTSDSTTKNADGSSTVDALTIEVFNVVKVTLFHAHADVDCATSKASGDFITGGGQITGTPSGNRADFGLAAGTVGNAFWGHLNYVDQTANLHVKATAITAYDLVDAKTRRIQGNAEINGQDGFTFTVEAADNGEPGTSDTFNISLSSGYQAGGPLTHGNIQLHNLTGK